MYRGNILKRRKIWLQDGSVADGTLIYRYTGFTYAVAPATSDWNDNAMVADMCRLYNEFIALVPGAPAANHGIVTAYDDGKANIGMHSDKMDTLHADTLISVLKLGGASRRFRIERATTGAEIFDDVIASGDLVVMTPAANAATKHGVPELEAAGDVALSGSIVWRTAATLLTPDELAAKIRATEAGRATRKRRRE
jgi:alkylated DNA repair dioxygenase AlkB